MALILAAKFSKLDTQAALMKSLIDAIGREQANTLMEQAVADAIVENAQYSSLSPGKNN